MWNFVIFSTLSYPCCTLLLVGRLYSFHRTFQRLFSLGGMLSRLFLYVLMYCLGPTVLSLKDIVFRRFEKGYLFLWQFGQAALPQIDKSCSPDLRPRSYEEWTLLVWAGDTPYVGLFCLQSSSTYSGLSGQQRLVVNNRHRWFGLPVVNCYLHDLFHYFLESTTSPFFLGTSTVSERMSGINYRNKVGSSCG